MDSDSGAPSSPSDAGGSARYVYLLGRLRARQITMEEATELFAVMQGMIRAASLRAPSPPPSGSVYPPPPPPPGVSPAVSDDLYWMSLLALGAGAGLGSAIMKRAMGGPVPKARGDKASG